MTNITVNYLAQIKHVSRRTIRRLIECGWSDARILREVRPGKRYSYKANWAQRMNKTWIKALVLGIEKSHRQSINDLLTRLFEKCSFKEAAEALNVSQLTLRKIIVLCAKQHRDQIYKSTPKERKYLNES